MAAPRIAGPQPASIPSPPPAPTISRDYRSLLSDWFNAHKLYPEEARQRGEQAHAVLRFRIPVVCAVAAAAGSPISTGRSRT